MGWWEMERGWIDGLRLMWSWDRVWFEDGLRLSFVFIAVWIVSVYSHCFSIMC